MDGSHWVRPPKHGVSVVFIHGFLSSSETAWRHKNGTWWPELLKHEDDLEEIGIYVFDYRSDVLSASYNLLDVVTSLKERLEHHDVLKSRRIIFVCHSLGGIVARKFLVEHQLLLARLATEIGFFLAASPSLGSRLAEGAIARILIKAFGHTQADALRFAQNNVWLNDLDTSFMNLKESGELPIAGKELVEDTFLFMPGLFRRQVVEPFSAARYFGESFKVPHSNHESIAKPANREAIQHELLRDFIRRYTYRGGRFGARKVELTIGLSSESPETLSRMLGICSSVMNVLLQRPDNLVPFDVHIEVQRDYNQSFEAFDAHLEQYDVVMLDDLWLPHFEPHLLDLNGLESFEDRFAKHRFEEVFLESLTSACMRPNAPECVFAIPVSGNVQLLMYRRDLVSQVTEAHGRLFAFEGPDELLEFILSPEAKAAAETPFLIRYETDNDIAENFWQVLRGYGYVEAYGERGEVLIPTTLARKALEWVQRAHPKGPSEHFGWEAISSFTGDMNDKNGRGPALMTFGWPVWVMPDLIRNPDSCRFLGMKQFLRHPITGFWSLAVPRTSRHPEEALKVILALAATPDLQVLMAEAGLVPVVKEFPEGKLKNDHPAWKAYLDTVRDALRSGRPRPRSARWREIERQLARRIREGELSDCGDLFRLVADGEIRLSSAS